MSSAALTRLCHVCLMVGRPPLLALSSDLGGGFTVGAWLCLNLLWHWRGEVTARVPNQIWSLILNKQTYQCGHTE